jgi:glycosyltransferase involved in cell wall biosynthesis
MTPSDWRLAAGVDGQSRAPVPLPVVIATMLRPDDFGGVHTHVQQILSYLEAEDTPGTLITPFSWNRLVTYPAFAPRLILERVSGSASVAWYRYWHELFLRKALHRRLAEIGECVVYAQGPQEARAALRARRGPDQRVIMAVHYKVSQADEWVNRIRGAIKRNGLVFRMVREAERETIPAVDGIVFVSEWARFGVLTWLPEATAVPYSVIGNFIKSMDYQPDAEARGDLVSVGGLDLAKNHRFLLEVLAAAKRVGRSLTLDIFGEGPLRRDLEQQASSLGLDGQVRFHGFRRDVREFLSCYRAYVHASYADTSSFAIIEAMAAGLPIVAARIGGIPELYDDGVEGRFWSLDDPAEASATLLELLDNESRHQTAAKAARDRFSRQFDAIVTAPRLLSFLYGEISAASSQSADKNRSPESFIIDSRLR